MRARPGLRVARRSAHLAGLRRRARDIASRVTERLGRSWMECARATECRAPARSRVPRAPPCGRRLLRRGEAHGLVNPGTALSEICAATIRRFLREERSAVLRVGAATARPRREPTRRSAW